LMVIQIIRKSLFEGTFAQLKCHKQNAGCEPVGQADRGPTAVHENLVQIRPTRSRLLTSPLGFLVIYACNSLGKTQSHKSNFKEWHSAKFPPWIGRKEKSKGRLRLPILKIVNFKWQLA
jgi:hypothetical protein